MKTCSKCKETKDLLEFDKNRTRVDGLHLYCKSCRKEERKSWYKAHKESQDSRNKRWKQDNREAWNQLTRQAYKRNPGYYKAKSSHRRSCELKATPSWSEKELIEKVYLKATDYGAHVDHIVPLKSEVVCGLHVWANLQLLPPTDNISKGNRFWPDSWD